MGGSTPRVQPPVLQPTPKLEDKAIQDAIAETIRRRGQARGYRSTILSKDFLDPQSVSLQQTLGS